MMKNSGTKIFILFTAFIIILSCGSKKNKIVNLDNLSDTVITQQLEKDTGGSKEMTENVTNVSVENASTYTGADFTVISATSQQWHGGAKGSGGGVNYEVSIISQLSSSQLIIDELWIAEIFHETSASRKFPKTPADGFSAADTIYLHAGDYHKDSNGPKIIDDNNEPKEVQDTKQNTPAPYKYTGEALIGYKINGERKYKEIAKITVKSPLFYP
jgi:hypothetical protein